MSTDPFTEADRYVRERAEKYADETAVTGGDAVQREIGFIAGWKAARDHLAAQEPTEDERLALIDSLAEQAGVFIMPLTASMALQDSRRAARRDEETR